VGTSRRQHENVVVGRPLEQAAQVVAVRIQRPSAIARQERQGGELGVIDDEPIRRAGSSGVRKMLGELL